MTDLSLLTLANLKSIASQIKLKNRSKMNKQELIDAISKKTMSRKPIKTPTRHIRYKDVDLTDEEVEELGKKLNLEFKSKSYRYRVSQIAKTLAQRLCDCIKKVKSKSNLPEGRAIAICRKSVVQNRGVDFATFSCKNGPMFH